MKMDILVRLMNMQMELKGRIVIFKSRIPLLANNSNLLPFPHSQRIFLLHLSLIQRIVSSHSYSKCFSERSCF